LRIRWPRDEIYPQKQFGHLFLCYMKIRDLIFQLIGPNNTHLKVKENYWKFLFLSRQTEYLWYLKEFDEFPHFGSNLELLHKKEWYKRKIRFEGPKYLF